MCPSPHPRPCSIFSDDLGDDLAAVPASRTSRGTATNVDVSWCAFIGEQVGEAGAGAGADGAGRGDSVGVSVAEAAAEMD